jgi:hypothetical protein
MSKRTLYLHIGTRKTGSTTLQFYLNHFKQKLKRENIYYLSGSDKIVTDDRIIRKFKEVNPGYVAESREKFERILSKYNESNISFVSSAEEFSGDPFTSYKNGDLVAEMLYRVTRDFDLDIKIIIYLRRQDDFFESLYTHSIYLGKSHSFNEFLNSFDEHSFQWLNIIEAFSERFGKNNISVKRFHRNYLPDKNSLVQGFGEIINSQILRNFNDTKPRNTSYSRDMLEMMRVANREFGLDGKKIRKLFRASDNRKSFEKFSFFTPDERLKFYSNYLESNNKIAKDYIESSENELFPMPEIGNSPPAYPGLDLDRVIISISQVLQHMDEVSEMRYRKTVEECRSQLISYRIRRKLSALLKSKPGLKNFLKKLSLFS